MKLIRRLLLLACTLPTSVWSHVTSESGVKHPHVPVQLERRESSTESTSAAPGVCTAPKCQAWAKHIKESLAPNYTEINPCVNFESYACDGWRNTHQYRPEQGSLSVSSVMSDTNRDLLHAILDGQYPQNTTLTGKEKDFDMKNFEMMKTVYNTCMDEVKIKSYGVTPVRKILDEFEAVYPLNGPASGAENAKAELTKALAWLYKRGVSGLIGASTSADDMNPDTMILVMGSSDIQLAKQYYNKSNVLTNYTRAVAEMYQVLLSGKPIDEESIPLSKNTSLFEKAKRIVDFETVIAQKTPDPEQANDIKYYYNLKTLKEIEAMAPQISLLEYLKSLTPPGYAITPDRKVIMSDINYYTNLSAIIQATPRSTLHDYFEWRLYQSWAGRLNNNYTAPMRRFNNVLMGKEPDALPARWRSCVSEVDSALGHLLSGAFIERAFTKKDKQLGDQIISDIKSVFGETFKTLDWMTNKTQAVAAKKVVNIIQKVGFQTKNPNQESPEEVNNYYARLQVTDNFFENGQNFLVFGQNISWYNLLKPTDRDRWDMTAPTVNAYFSPSLNEIVFPAGIMQMPVFSGDLPEYVSYGGFGATAGHELTHGFDDNGAKYDEVGRYRDWWDEATTVRFENKTTCFVKQYGQYSVEGLEGERVPVNGKLTLGENIADAGGLNAAYRAWKKREVQSPNPQLPGLEKWTNDQLFFLSYANSWCEKDRVGTLLQQVLSDPHSPSDKRVLGPLDNAPGFREAFNCPVKKATCELW